MIPIDAPSPNFDARQAGVRSAALNAAFDQVMRERRGMLAVAAV